MGVLQEASAAASRVCTQATGRSSSNVPLGKNVDLRTDLFNPRVKAINE